MKFCIKDAKLAEHEHPWPLSHLQLDPPTQLPHLFLPHHGLTDPTALELSVQPVATSTPGPFLLTSLVW